MTRGVPKNEIDERNEPFSLCLRWNEINEIDELSTCKPHFCSASRTLVPCFHAGFPAFREALKSAADFGCLFIAMEHFANFCPAHTLRRTPKMRQNDIRQRITQRVAENV